MMGSISGEVDFCYWLIDYLVINIGCIFDEVDFDLLFVDFGVSFCDVVVLFGELLELLGRIVLLIDFWGYLMINVLVVYLVVFELSFDFDVVVKCGVWNLFDELIVVVGMGCCFFGGILCLEVLWDFFCECCFLIS